MNTGVPISPGQMRKARALRGWTRERLGGQSETTAGFVRIYELTGRVQLSRPCATGIDQLAALRTAFEAVGVTFTNGNEPWVRLKAIE